MQGNRYNSHFVFKLQFHMVIRDFKIWQRDSNKDN